MKCRKCNQQAIEDLDLCNHCAEEDLQQVIWEQWCEDVNQAYDQEDYDCYKNYDYYEDQEDADDVS